MRHMGWVVGVVAVAVMGSAGGVEARSVLPPGPTRPWVIESAEYSGRITDHIARIKAVLAIRVFQERWTEIPLAFPGVRITKVKLAR